MSCVHPSSMARTTSVTGSSTQLTSTGSSVTKSSTKLQAALTVPVATCRFGTGFDICCFKGAKGVAAAADYGRSSKGYMQGQVQFLVNPGEREHVIPVDMVIDQLFAP